MSEDIITDHKMHSEFYRIEEKSAEIINAAKREGRRVIAVGTTSVRTLESVADETGKALSAVRTVTKSVPCGIKNLLSVSILFLSYEKHRPAVNFFVS